MADDGSSPEAEEGQPDPDERRRQILIGGAAVVLLVLGALIWWRGAEESTERSCTAAGAIGSPAAASSDEAFEAWFLDSGAAASLRWVGSSGVAPPEIDDFEKTGDRSWEWPYAEGQSVLVETLPDPEADESEAWRVSGVNGCTYN